MTLPWFYWRSRWEVRTYWKPRKKKRKMKKRKNSRMPRASVATKENYRFWKCRRWKCDEVSCCQAMMKFNCHCQRLCVNAVWILGDQKMIVRALELKLSNRQPPPNHHTLSWRRRRPSRCQLKWEKNFVFWFLFSFLALRQKWCSGMYAMPIFHHFCLFVPCAERLTSPFFLETSQLSTIISIHLLKLKRSKETLKFINDTCAPFWSPLACATFEFFAEQVCVARRRQHRIFVAKETQFASSSN